MLGNYWPEYYWGDADTGSSPVIPSPAASGSAAAGMARYTETCTTYAPSHAVGSDLNVVPNAVTLIRAGVTCNIHRGVPQARDEAMALGIVAELPALLYAPPAMATAFGDRYVVVDQAGIAWVVRGAQSVRTRFAATAHVKCLLTRLLSKPDGVP